MAHFHSRSNSLPSECSPVMNEIRDRLRQLKGSEATSTTGTSMCSNLAGLVGLHEALNNMIQTPSFPKALSHDQYGNWIDEILDGSLALVDLCGFSRDVVSLSKESIQDLKSSIRRNRGQSTASSDDDISSYVASRKKLYKMVNKKCVKNSKRFSKNSTTLIQEDVDLKTMVQRQDQSIEVGPCFQSSLKQAALYAEADQECSYINDLFNVHFYEPMKGMDNATAQNILKKLKVSEIVIHELEEGLEALFRSLVKTRVSLLKVLSDH